MGLPTSDQIAAFSQWLRIGGLARSLRDARPALADQVEEQPSHVAVRLPPSAAPRAKVILGEVHNGYWPYWTLVVPEETTIREYRWDFRTDKQILIEAVLTAYDAATTNMPMPSPWRWAESTRSLVVQVADGLTDHGIQVTGVVGANRVLPDHDDDSRITHVDSAFGDAVTLTHRDRSATLARKPHLGWVLDLESSGAPRGGARRLPLDRAEDHGRDPVPGLRVEDPHTIVRATLDALQRPEPRNTPDAAPAAGAEDIGEAVHWWMRELGYRDHRRLTETDHPAPVGVVVLDRKRQGTLADVRQAFAEATVQRVSLVMVSTTGFTRDAAAWADKAGFPLFWLNPADHRVWRANTVGQEHLPTCL